MTPRQAVLAWMAAKGWKPMGFQSEVWRAMGQGLSGLLHATTGSGKTYAVWLGALQALAKSQPGRAAPPLTVLWVTPMRALAADSAKALEEALVGLQPEIPGLRGWTLGQRTGDTAARERSAQQRRWPTLLVTTPESLTLLLTRPDAREVLGRVALLVADEWHELLGSKRGVQLQLAVARLAVWNPALMVWGMSATLGNLREAQQVLLAPLQRSDGQLVQGRMAKKLQIDSLLPPEPLRFTWAGQLGLRMLPQVVAELESAPSTLLFVNQRALAERWYQALLEARPDWAGQIALHHGALDAGVRDWVEQGLKAGALKAVVCTSSLDLGVDFLPVARVLQIGSPKSVARLLQRAGRSGHAPGRPSRITLVPTHGLELLEFAALRAAVQAGEVESRRPPEAPMDVLVQHLVSMALGGGFEPAALLAEVRRSASYARLTESEWQWALDFVSHGGAALGAYPDYQRVVADADGVWRMPDARLARRHRSNIGTIIGQASMVVQVLRGARLGTLDEGFVSRLSLGDCFMFAGQVLELVKVQEMTAYVRRAARSRAVVPRWQGSRLGLSPVLARHLQALLQTGSGQPSAELQAARPLLDLQAEWSALPGGAELLLETWKSRDGWHVFVYPLAGRQMHQALASWLTWRVAQLEPGSFSMAVNEYGLELLSASARDWPPLLAAVLAQPPSQAQLLTELAESVNASEMAGRQFREMAKIAGLIFQSHPGERRSARQLQASAKLFFEVFQRYDPDNALLRQARQEVLTQALDAAQLHAWLQQQAGRPWTVVALPRISPMAFPLWVERIRDRLSNEDLAQRIARMLGVLEGAAPAGATVGANPLELREELAFSHAAPLFSPNRGRRRRSAG